ncbi:MAG: SH3 domain-containing protein, partial [Armatimonadetes bacterium]|nr:SH3 domain-containing protein [Anaerolineae bacterium]
PFATVSESSPSHQWGLGAPLAGMPADNFSGRWTLTQNFAAGNYGIQVNADDGVRVFVNGVAYINQWALVTGEGYTAGFSLPGGVATIVVEYFEAGFNAFLTFQLFAPQQPPAPPVGSSVATVTAATLNVRNAPTTIGSSILTKVARGTSYGVIGKNAQSTWWLIQAGDVRGWVSALFVSVTNPAGVSMVDGTPITTPPPANATQFTVTTLTNLNLRAEANASAAVLLVIPRGSNAVVVARSADNNWLRVTYNGAVGWINLRFVSVTPALNLAQIPVN